MPDEAPAAEERAAAVDRIRPLPIPADPDPGPALAAIDQAIALTEARLEELRAARGRIEALLSVRLQPALPGIFAHGGVVTSGALADRADPDGAVRREVGEALVGDPDDDGPIDAGVTEDEADTVETPGAEPVEGAGESSQPPAEAPPPAPVPSTDPDPDPAAAKERPRPRTERRARKRQERERRDAAKAEAERQERKAKHDTSEKAERILAFIVDNPGTTGSEVAEALDMGHPAVSTVIVKLAQKGKIRRERDGRTKRLYAKGAEAAPADGDGAKTGLERWIVASLRERPQTLEGLAVKRKLKGNVMADVLAALMRRGVIDRRVGAGSAQPLFYLKDEGDG